MPDTIQVIVSEYNIDDCDRTCNIFTLNAKEQLIDDMKIAL